MPKKSIFSINENKFCWLIKVVLCFKLINTVRFTHQHNSGITCGPFAGLYLISYADSIASGKGQRPRSLLFPDTRRPQG